MKDHVVCPGAKFMRQPKPEFFTCPKCGEEVEIWSDEIAGACPKCKQKVMKDGNMSCLEWCKYAEDCVGTEIYEKYMKDKAYTIKEKLLIELQKYFGSDLKRINHAKKVLQYAEELLIKEKADTHIVIPAAILHDVGIKPAEEKYNSSAGKYQEELGPDIARPILLKQGLMQDDIEKICNIIGHHHSPGEKETINFKVIYDADCLVNLAETLHNKSKDQIQNLINNTFLTSSGKELAQKIYLN